MTIAERSPSRHTARFKSWETLARGAVMAAAVFCAAPKHAQAQVDFNGTGGTTTDPNNVNAQSWFNVTQWSYADVTGTLPESFSQPPASPAPIICANNAVMPSVGVVFDPKDDVNTPGGPNANYTANLSNLSGRFYISGVTGAGTEPAAPNKLTVESGTIVTPTMTVGRDAPGILSLNGGTFITTTEFEVQAQTNGRTFLGTGTFEYHGGTLEAGYVFVGGEGSTMGASLTSAGVGSFVVYNDGPAGAILSAGGVSLAPGSAGMGTIGIAEFHYDLNAGGIGGTRPIQTNWNNGSVQTNLGILSLLNSTNQSARLNLVLDTAPTVTNGVVQ